MLLVADGPVDAADEPTFAICPSAARCRLDLAASRDRPEAVRGAASSWPSACCATARRTGGRTSTPFSSRRRRIPSQFFAPPNTGASCCSCRCRSSTAASAAAFAASARRRSNSRAGDSRRRDDAGELGSARRRAKRWQSARAQPAPARSAAADQAQQVVDIVNISFRAGASTNIEVIDAERSARDADTAVGRGRRHAAPRPAESAHRARPLSPLRAPLPACALPCSSSALACSAAR